MKRWLAEHNISYEEYDYGFEDTDRRGYAF